jgi:hypothetical protein
MINFSKKFGLITLAFLILFTSVLIHGTGHVAAAAKYPTCQNTYMELWDWASNAQYGGIYRGIASQSGETSFNKDTSSYFIFKTQTSVDNGRNQFDVVFMDSPNNMTLDTVSGVDYLYHGGANHAIINSEPTSVTAKSQSWSGTPGGNWSGYASQGKFAVAATSYASPFKITLDSNINCVVVSHNVIQGPAWSYDNFETTPPIGEDGGSGCAITNISCILTGAFNKVSNTLTGVANAAFGLFAKLFMPDSVDIANKVTDLQSYLAGKLGFLTYPATFLIDVFNSFTGTTSTWCTAISCSKNFGTLLGKPFNVDFLTGKNTYPTYWTYAIDVIRGLTILELAMLVRRKYITITGKN